MSFSTLHATALPAARCMGNSLPYTTATPPPPRPPSQSCCRPLAPVADKSKVQRPTRRRGRPARAHKPAAPNSAATNAGPGVDAGAGAGTASGNRKPTHRRRRVSGDGALGRRRDACPQNSVAQRRRRGPLGDDQTTDRHAQHWHSGDERCVGPRSPPTERSKGLGSLSPGGRRAMTSGGRSPVSRHPRPPWEKESARDRKRAKAARLGVSSLPRRNPLSSWGAASPGSEPGPTSRPHERWDVGTGNDTTSTGFAGRHAVASWDRARAIVPTTFREACVGSQAGLGLAGPSILRAPAALPWRLRCVEASLGGFEKKGAGPPLDRSHTGHCQSCQSVISRSGLLVCSSTV